MPLVNRTRLDSDELRATMLAAVDGWPVRRLRVHVRHSRGADFSGTCYYKRNLIYVNLGAHVRYPYGVRTSIARARSNARAWWKPVYTLELPDSQRLVLFVFLHEFYHWLVHKARRNPRQKESMCDRFATRILVDRFGGRVYDDKGRSVPREAWDIQDVEGFVAAARAATRQPGTPRKAATRPVPRPPAPDGQLLLFDV
jgi:hypothetical protein